MTTFSTNLANETPGKEWPIMDGDLPKKKWVVRDTAN